MSRDIVHQLASFIQIHRPDHSYLDPVLHINTQCDNYTQYDGNTHINTLYAGSIRAVEACIYSN